MTQRFTLSLIVSITLVFGALCSALYTPPTQAHKMKNAFTIVLFNDRTGYLEVMHRFVLHDAEEAAWRLFNSKADIISDDKTQAQFAAYVETRFQMKNQDGEVLPLELLGYQNDAGYFWVYQEIKMPNKLTKLSIRNDVLREIWSEQFNVVNIEGIQQTTSLHFSDSDTWRSAEIVR